MIGLASCMIAGLPLVAAGQPARALPDQPAQALLTLPASRLVLSAAGA